MKLTKRQIDMLQRVALAEKFTSPPTSNPLTVAQRFKVLDKLEDLGLVIRPQTKSPYRLTNKGREELRARPWPYGDRVKP